MYAGMWLRGQCFSPHLHQHTAMLMQGLMQGLRPHLPHQPLHRAEVKLATNFPSSNPFRVATFNILADGLAQTGDFVKCPVSCLQWEYRLPLILQEIRAANADVICLQELNHFDAIAAALIPEGYCAFFRAKQPSPAIKFGFPADGIGVFYRHSRFSCSPQPAAHCFESMDGQPAAQGFVTAQLLDKQSGRHVLVAATHLKAKAGAEHELTRVHQVYQLLQEVEHLLERHQQLQQQQQQLSPGSRQLPAVVLCGDFNTTPDNDTVQVIKQHALQLSSIWDVPWATSSSSASPRSCSHRNGTSNANSNGSSRGGCNGNGQGSSSGSGSGVAGETHPTPGDAAAAAAAAGDGGGAAGAADADAPAAEQGNEFTTFKFRSSGVAKRTIDYMMYSQQQLVPTSRWRMLSEAEIGPEGLPSRHYPSDHVCVMCQFGWRDE